MPSRIFADKKEESNKLPPLPPQPAIKKIKFKDVIKSVEAKNKFMQALYKPKSSVPDKNSTD